MHICVTPVLSYCWKVSHLRFARPYTLIRVESFLASSDAVSPRECVSAQTGGPEGSQEGKAAL